MALPAFANAHCHLDLSEIHCEDLTAESFASWVEGLVARRRALDETALEQAVAVGARELLEGGTVAVGDIDSSGRSLRVLRTLPLEGVAFREILGDDPTAVLAAAADAPPEPATGVVRGLSPHAPYSTAERVFAAVFQAALRTPGLRVATHLGETLEERVFLQQDRGPLRQLFDGFGLRRPSWATPSSSVVGRALALDPPPGRVLAVHSNYLEAEDRAALQRTGAAVVFCPQSHAYFHHDWPHPVTELLGAGIPVALGTDSRASNPRLSLWDELWQWRRQDARMEAFRMLRCATATGRHVLGLEPADLRPMHPATFQIARAQDRTKALPETLLEQAVSGGMVTVATVLRGEVVGGGL